MARCNYSTKHWKQVFPMHALNCNLVTSVISLPTLTELLGFSVFQRPATYLRLRQRNDAIRTSDRWLLLLPTPFRTTTLRSFTRFFD